MTQISCNCCQHGMDKLGSFRDYLHYKCNNCGYEHFKNENVTMSQDYEIDADYLDDLNLFPDAGDRMQWHHHRAIDFIGRHSRAGAATLDVGCFDGFFVRQLLDRGYDAHGLDFNRTAIARGQDRFGLAGRISNRTMTDLAAGGAQFDVITMFEVIEHLDEFTPILEDCVRLLKPDGLLVISTPNSQMSWRPPLDFPPHHLSRFTPLSLRKMAGSLGLTLVSSAEQSSLFDFIRNYIGSLFRHKETASMRGGEFRHRATVDRLRRIANRLRGIAYRVLQPADALLHRAGFRYIGQLMIARKPGR